jgi:hypothetical protein
VLWFDTEDYILPASDDAALRIASFLSDHGLRATFKIVGEKARALKQRGRGDVIAALAHQEIGYHSNTHSQHPTVAEYESVLGWEEGGEEFRRREKQGFDDVVRIFGKLPTCYGQPGSSWAPQVFPELKRWGIQVYLDEGEQVQLQGKPYWYGGLLNIFGIDSGPQMEPNHDWSNLEEAKEYFRSVYPRLRSQPGGGLLSFMFHPTQFVAWDFWDAVNFAKGANPPRSEWKAEGMKSPADRERSFQYLENLVMYLKSFPGVRFITASEAHALYSRENKAQAFGRAEIAAVSQSVAPEVNFQIHPFGGLAASEIFALLNTWAAQKNSEGPVAVPVTPYGPESATPASMAATPQSVSLNQFLRTCADVQDFLEANQRIPDVVWFGSQGASPEAYLVSLARLVGQMLAGTRPADTVSIVPARLAAASWVSQDSPSIWDWPIFPDGFHSEHLMELARLQAWTLKPAILPSNSHPGSA